MIMLMNLHLKNNNSITRIRVTTTIMATTVTHR